MVRYRRQRRVRSQAHAPVVLQACALCRPVLDLCRHRINTNSETILQPTESNFFQPSSPISSERELPERCRTVRAPVILRGLPLPVGLVSGVNASRRAQQHGGQAARHVQRWRSITDPWQFSQFPVARAQSSVKHVGVSERRKSYHRAL